jgi:hypothetical protein
MQTGWMVGQGTAAFYREQFARLALLAIDTRDPEAKLEILEIAASFKKLAEYADSHESLAAPAKESA